MLKKIFLGMLLSLVVSLGVAGESLQPLAADKAFVFTAHADEHSQIALQWNVAPGYYLYQNKFNFSVSSDQPIKIGQVAWPKGVDKKDVRGESHSIYSGLVKVALPLEGSYKGPVTLKIHYQGCSLSGFCYPPVNKYLNVDLADIKPAQDLTPQVGVSAGQVVVSDQDMAQAIFAKHSVIFIMLSFLGLGLLLAFTPCVLPMIPILSGIIVGHKKKVSTSKAFMLSLIYVAGMAVTYAVAGVVVALLGSSIQVFFQKTWVIVLFSGIFLLLSLSLFGLYELQLPGEWQRRTAHLSNRLQGGSYLGVFLMGCLSTLIVSPCVSAPLVGVLAYIAQTGDIVLGAVSLLMLGIGMGIPLLLIGASAGKWLPKAGHWMDLIKKLFGILMLGVAVWMLSRIIPGPVAMFLWAILFVMTGVFMVVFYKTQHRGVLVLRIMGTLAFVYGLVLIAGAAMGHSNPLSPWDSWYTISSKSAVSEPAYFAIVKNENELDQQLAIAKKNKQAVILDFYATWCVSCVIMDVQIFNRTDVRDKLAGFVRLRADVTDNNVFDQELMKRYHVVAPPTMIFFNADGQELKSQHVVGEISVNKFLSILDKVKE